jgi:hypothetical protein
MSFSAPSLIVSPKPTAPTEPFAILVRYFEGIRLIEDHNGVRWERVPRICTWGEAPTIQEANEIARNLRTGNRDITTVVCLYSDRFTYFPR